MKVNYFQGMGLGRGPLSRKESLTGLTLKGFKDRWNDKKNTSICRLKSVKQNGECIVDINPRKTL